MSAYNAVTWLLDRNVDEGRGAKLAFTDTVSELTYGDLQKQSCRVANLLRRLGVRREERVAMIMLDTVDFPAVFLGAIRAGVVPVPLNTLLTSDQYAYVLADCRARVLFVSEALLPVVKDMVGRMADLDHVIVAGNDDVIEVRHPTEHILDHRQQRLGNEQHPRAAIRQHIGILIRGQQRIE
ncbi:MAG TPA: AMP-binding protein, partial [Bradyrhizobium sp.]|nr:AMP-binding protein [Bradyrhizobium sp.]